MRRRARKPDKTPDSDATAYWARSGLMHEVRPDHRAVPARSVAGMGDHPTAMALYGGIVTALYQREKTGRGGEVRASLMAGGMWANSYLIQAKLCGVTFPPRPPRDESTVALSNIYRTSDDRYFMLAVLNERQWPALARAVGMPELTDDARFARPEARAGNARLLISLLDEAFAGKPLAEWRVILDAAGLTFGVVGTVAEIATDPQALATGMLRPLAETGMMTVDSPFTLSEAEKVPLNWPPATASTAARSCWKQAIRKPRLPLCAQPEPSWTITRPRCTIVETQRTFDERDAQWTNAVSRPAFRPTADITPRRRGRFGLAGGGPAG